MVVDKESDDRVTDSPFVPSEFTFVEKFVSMPDASLGVCMASRL